MDKIKSTMRINKNFNEDGLSKLVNGWENYDDGRYKKDDFFLIGENLMKEYIRYL